MAHRQTYMRFLNLIHTLDGHANAPQMDLDAKKLLEVVSIRHDLGKPLTVTDAMALNHIASPATIHRKLDQLLELGMVVLAFEGKNRRTKYVTPTLEAEKYFDQLGKALQEALSVN